MVRIPARLKTLENAHSETKRGVVLGRRADTDWVFPGNAGHSMRSLRVIHDRGW